VRAGFGLEAASLNEVKQALRCGCAPHKVVFDSPCKSRADIDFALRAGVHINANTVAEVGRIRAALALLPEPSSSTVGLRVNPLVGPGDIAALSTATSTSKFGVPFLSDSASSSSVQAILGVFEEHAFLTSIMCHVGSQGMSLEAMAEGARRVLWLADLVDHRCGPEKRIRTVDLGGGLAVNYKDDRITPSFAEYAQTLQRVCGEDSLKSAVSGRQLITEFGKALVAKSGAVATRVEDVLEQEQRRTAICHAGADLLLRTAYCPTQFPLRVALLDRQTLSAKPSDPAGKDRDGQVCFVGPLCFSGDVITADWDRSGQWAGVVPAAGDVCVVLDSGANTLSLFSRHCSRASPAVFAFRRVRRVHARGGEDLAYVLCCIREEETADEVLAFWG